MEGAGLNYRLGEVAAVSKGDASRRVGAQTNLNYRRGELAATGRNTMSFYSAADAAVRDAETRARARAAIDASIRGLARDVGMVDYGEQILRERPGVTYEEARALMRERYNGFAAGLSDDQLLRALAAPDTGRAVAPSPAQAATPRPFAAGLDDDTLQRSFEALQ